jgi:hypothetical protein
VRLMLRANASRLHMLAEYLYATAAAASHTSHSIQSISLGLAASLLSGSSSSRSSNFQYRAHVPSWALNNTNTNTPATTVVGTIGGECGMNSALSSGGLCERQTCVGISRLAWHRECTGLPCLGTCTTGTTAHAINGQYGPCGSKSSLGWWEIVGRGLFLCTSSVVRSRAHACVLVLACLLRYSRPLSTPSGLADRSVVSFLLTHCCGIGIGAGTPCFWPPLP